MAGSSPEICRMGRMAEMPAMTSEAPPIGTALRTFFGTKATSYGVFMFSRMKESDPVDSSTIEARSPATTTAVPT